MINKLNQDVINKICAGEVIHRPLNVVKELIENSLDAGANNLTVILKNGGLKQIFIKDNGCGIRKEDLNTVCNRFTTSKLKSLEDFNSLNTFGFRGEALSSMSIVGDVTIISKIAESICGYRAEYINCHLKNGDESIIPIAADDGTTVIVENLFFNMPTRKNALSSEANEFNLVQNLILKYSLIFSQKCGFILKKHGDPFSVINTKLNNSLFNNIDLLFSQKISPFLIPIDCQNEKFEFKIHGYFSNNDLNLKQMSFILSINYRLVEYPQLKRSIKDLYKDFLMKGGHPFLIIFIEIPSKNIDVNVHPNKTEVSFLYDNEIISAITKYIENKLKDKPYKDISLNKSTFNHTIFNSSLDFTTIQKNDLAFPLVHNERPSQDVNETNLSQCSLSKFISLNKEKLQNSKRQDDEKSISKTPRRPENLNRVDFKIQRLDQYLNRPNLSKSRRTIDLTSLSELRQELADHADLDLLNILTESSFVGVIDENFCVIQQKLNLFMLKTLDFNKELFYTAFLLDFGNFDYFRFEYPLSIEKLLIAYFEVKYPSTEKEILALNVQKMIELFISFHKMLDDYFSIKINKQDKTIEALPILVEGHQPNFIVLPEFIYRLINNTDWKKEKMCFQNVGEEIARFYSYPSARSSMQTWAVLMENRLYPLFKALLLPSRNLNSSIHLITNVSNLYKVFERC